MADRREKLWLAMEKAAEARSNQAALGLNRARQAVERLRVRQQGLLEAQEQYRQTEKERMGSNGLTVSELQGRRQFSTMIQQALDALVLEIAGAAERERQAHQLLSEQLQKQQTYEKLRLAAREERLTWISEQERKSLDEIASLPRYQKKEGDPE